MFHITAHNPDDALRQGLSLLGICGKKEPSRNGNVLVSPQPVTTVYPAPRNRVALSPLRDANPFFHLFEALWMLAGRNDLEFLTRFVPRFSEFSDDGQTLNGAYGYRWRYHFGTDQLYNAISELKANPNSRRVVIAMWDGSKDLMAGRAGPDQSRDVPGNPHVYVRVSGDALLDLMVMCRSNDIVWGAYGANVVHFTFLQEYLACALGKAVGTFTQVSWNYHAYIDRDDVRKLMNGADEPKTRTHQLENPPLFTEPRDWDTFDRALKMFLKDPEDSEPPFWRFPFLNEVALPMFVAHKLHKAGKTEEALQQLAPDVYLWHAAGYEWLERRLKKSVPTAEVR